MKVPEIVVSESGTTAYLRVPVCSFADGLKSLLVVSSSLLAPRTSFALDVPVPLTPVAAENVMYGNFLG